MTDRLLNIQVPTPQKKVVPSTIWGLLIIKTDYLTLLAFLVIHPASHGKRGRYVILRQIKYEQMFLHHLYAACTFRPYKSTPVLKLFRIFTGKMTRGLSLQIVFSPLFVETLLFVVELRYTFQRLRDYYIDGRSLNTCRAYVVLSFRCDIYRP